MAPRRPGRKAASPLPWGLGDTIDKHVADTLAAGAGIVDEKMTRMMVAEGPARIHDLLGYGVPFDRDLEGKLLLSREAAHSERRIVRVKGDMAGKAIMEALIAAVRNTPSIRVLEGYVVEELVRAGPLHLRRHRTAGCRAVEEARRRFRPVPSCSARAASAISFRSPPIRPKPAARASAWRPAPARSSPIRNSSSSTRRRSISAAIRRRSRPRRCAAMALT